MLTATQLAQIMPNLPQDTLQQFLPRLNAAMQTCGIDTVWRTAAFVAQLAHESGEFRWMEEIWGPTAAQLRYEPPSDLAKKLGNTQPGDGKRFKGRGPIQITGRANYQKYGALLGADLIANPARAAADLAFATAGLFWKSNGLNELADAQQFVTITRRINGGTNGLDDRQKYYARAKSVLGAVAAPRDGPPMTALKRGVEAIRAADKAMPPTRKVAVEKAVTKKPASKKPVAKRVGTRRKPA